MYSSDKTTNYLLSEYADYGFLETYCKDVLNRNYISLDEISVNYFFHDLLSSFYDNNSLEDLSMIKDYSGTYFKEINSLLRGNFDCYLYSDNDIKYFRKMADVICNVSYKNECCLFDNIKVYRGVTLFPFKRFGVSGIDDVYSLKGQYIYEAGFTSTSLIREKSFFLNHSDCNVEIEYLIPSESKDVIPLINGTFSYSSNQYELLINKGSLSKIIDVSVVDSKVYIKAIHIPVRVWDKNLDENLRKNVL